MRFHRWFLLACLVLAPLVVRAGPDSARARASESPRDRASAAQAS